MISRIIYSQIFTCTPFFKNVNWVRNSSTKSRSVRKLSRAIINGTPEPICGLMSHSGRRGLSFRFETKTEKSMLALSKWQLF